MKSLAAGKDETPIMKLLKVTLNCAQARLGTANYLNDQSINEIATVHEFNTNPNPEKEQEK